jgi:ribosomal protein S18 acetylase RimI-like enzyme
MPEFGFSARPPAKAADVAVLDQPIWSALTTEQRELAVGDDLARRFPVEVGPLTGLREQSDAAYYDLRALAGNGLVAQFLREPWEPRAGWSLVRDGLMDQMVWTEETGFRQELESKTELRELSEDDAPEMLALAKLTEPGPFGTRTHTLGRFFGIFESDVLVAMAGQRLHMQGFTELSAVCTHPDARGRAYSRVLMAQVMADILSRGETPMLHVFSANAPAIRVYRGLGFTLRRNLHLAVVKVAED